MVRVFVVLFWLCLIVGTYATGNVLGNWVVCLLALFFFVRSRRQKPDATIPPVSPASPARYKTSPTIASTPGTPQASTSAPQRPSHVAPGQRRWR